jgi:hypothetical protein
MSSIFGGGSNNSSAMQNALLQMQVQQQMAEQAAALRNTQGQQLALLSRSQAQNDNESASLSKPGLGRALLTYSPRDRQQLLGG